MGSSFCVQITSWNLDEGGRSWLGGTYQERMRLLRASGAGPVNLLILRLQQRQPPAPVSPTCESRRRRPAMMDRETVWLGGT